MRKLTANFHTLGIALAFVVLTLLAWQGTRTQDALLAANRSVTETLELLGAAQGTLSALQDVETGMRGYALTGEEAFLEPYHRGRARLGLQRQLLGEHLANQPARARWLAELDRWIARRLELAAANLALRRTGSLEAAAEQVRRGGGKQAMDRVRSLLAEFEAAERARLVREHDAVALQIDRGRRQLVLGGLVVAALLLLALVSVNRNLAMRARLVARAQAGETRQRAMLQAIPDTLWQVERDGTMHALSPTSGERSPTLPSGLAAAIREHSPALLADGELRAFDWRGEDGHEHEVRLVSTADGRGLAIVRDVTEAMRNRRDLLDRRAFLRSIVDTDENLIFVRDPEGRFVLANMALCDVLHLDPGQIEGRDLDALDGAPLIAPLLVGDAALVAGETEWRQEQVRIVDRRGQERWLQVLKRPLVLSDGRRQVLTVAVDVTARLRVERMKNEFVSTVSHELRTPLTSIRGALGLLGSGAAGELPAGTKPLVEIAHKNTERLVRLINDILDIEKLESGHVQLHLRVLPLRMLVEQSIAQNLPYAREFDVRLALLPGDDGMVEVDADRFAQVMANLLSNAIKHSPPGGTVEIGVSRRHRGLQIAVSDRGAGIPEAFRPHVFERFAQADASDVRQRGGTGLGLAITRSLVERMHGVIGFDSEPGEGTRFEVWLPEAAAVDSDSPRPSTGKVQPRIVLLADDAAVAVELAEMLARHGYATCVASTPAQARGLLDEDGVRGLVLDLVLAGENAPAFLRELRAQPRYRHLPVLLLGVQSPPGDADGLRGGAVGVVNWLCKPLDPEQVAEAVRTCLRGTRVQPAVLHVEDDADLRALVARLLAGQPLTLHAAANLAEARHAIAMRHHDLVILDLMLPDGDGAGLLPELGAAQPPTPAIIFSAQDTPLPDSRVVLGRLVKSRSDAAELAALIMTNLEHWPADHRPKDSR